MERQAELADLVSANSLNLYFSRSNRDRGRRNSSIDRDAARAWTLTQADIPTNFYKIEDNHVFSAVALRLDLRQLPERRLHDSHTAGLDGDPRGFPADEDVQIDYYDSQYHNNWYYFYAKDPQKQANVQVSKFFNTGSLNHELKFSFNYRTQIADSQTGLPGDQNIGSNTPILGHSRCSRRGVRTTYKTNYISGTLGDTITFGQPDDQRRSPVRPASSRETCRAGRSRTSCSRSSSRTVQFDGVRTTGSSSTRTGSRAPR